MRRLFTQMATFRVGARLPVRVGVQHDAGELLQLILHRVKAVLALPTDGFPKLLDAHVTYTTTCDTCDHRSTQHNPDWLWPMPTTTPFLA